MQGREMLREATRYVSIMKKLSFTHLCIHSLLQLDFSSGEVGSLTLLCPCAAKIECKNKHGHYKDNVLYVTPQSI